MRTFAVAAALVVTAVTISCNPEALTPPVRAPLSPAFDVWPATTLLAEIDDASPSSGCLACDGVAVALCLVYGWPGSADPRVEADATVGCEVSHRSGTTATFDFDASSSAGFDDFVAFITNGMDDELWTGQLLLDASGNYQAGAFSGGLESAKLAPAGSPDLVGSTLDFVRLIVNYLDITVAPVRVTVDARWQFFGRYSPQGEIDFLQEEVATSAGSASTSLGATLDAAESSLAKGATPATCGELRAFINHVKALMLSGELDAEVGATWIAHAQNAIEELCLA